jgi:hypothetical protein
LLCTKLLLWLLQLRLAIHHRQLLLCLLSWLRQVHRRRILHLKALHLPLLLIQPSWVTNLLLQQLQL